MNVGLRTRTQAGLTPHGRVVEVAGELHLTTSSGTTPLYRFAPLRLALMCSQSVPFASQWPEFLKPVLYRHNPLPPLAPGALPEHLQAQFGHQTRPSSGLRPWPQATYRGWPLYFCDNLTAPSDLFERVPVDLHPPAPAWEEHQPSGP